MMSVTEIRHLHGSDLSLSIFKRGNNMEEVIVEKPIRLKIKANAHYQARRT